MQHALNAHRSRIWDDICETVYDRFPDVKDGAEMQSVIWTHYIIASNVSIALFHNDIFVLERDELNDRGDEGTVNDRKASIELVGFLELRSGAWVFPKGENKISPGQHKK